MYANYGGSHRSKFLVEFQLISRLFWIFVRPSAHVVSLYFRSNSLFGCDCWLWSLNTALLPCWRGLWFNGTGASINNGIDIWMAVISSFLMSHCYICHTAWRILYHVTKSCKAQFITQSDLEIRSADVLRMLQCHILGVCRHYHTAIMRYKIMHSKAPEYLTEAFNLIRDSCAYNLRQRL